jgi:TRAP-type C4-dicarboxylate transport system permease small subunit|tara:strand:- start:678 stop:1256 length:579 start_codon:yes stop_codon:yes gene_type:complete
VIINTTDKLLIKLENFLNGFSAIAIFVLMLTAAVQVVSRKVFNLPIPGYIDIAEQSIAIFAFLSIAYCQRLGGHVRMEIFLSAMKGRSKWVSEAIQTTASILIISILMYFSFKHFQRAWIFGDSTIDIGLPTWPSKLMIPVALATLNLRLLIQLAGYIRLAIDPKLEPIGVPLIKDVVEQAEEEAAQIELIK